MNVKEYNFRKGNYSFSILNLGCAVTSICTPDRYGNVANITLPFPGAAENPEIITSSDKFLGLTVGRFANRIGGASFVIDGKRYSFKPNDGPNFLHSGPNGIWSRIWNVKHMDDGFLCSIKVTEEEDGFPGTADIRVRFSMSEDGVFRIHYSASCTEKCPINLTNHTYFNLTGDPSNDILSHLLVIDSHNIVGTGPGLIPDGKVIPVEGTAWDFTTERSFGERIDAPELSAAGGYDHAYIIDRIDGPQRGFARFIRVREPKSGRVLQAFTDLPAFHLYSGNFLSGDYGYDRRHGFCLESEFYPDCVNHPEFPSCIVSPGELFESTTVYHFYTEA